MPWADARDLLSQLQREPGSHLAASLQAWSWASNMTEVASLQLLQAYLNTHTDAKTTVRLVMPWDKPDPSEKADVTAEERAALRARLNERSAFRST